MPILLMRKILPLQYASQSLLRVTKPSHKMTYHQDMPASGQLKRHCLHIFDTAVKSVLPSNMVRAALQVTDNVLTVQEAQYELNHNVHVIAFGKAAIGMVRAAEDILGEHIVGGIASVPVGVQEAFTKYGKSDLLPAQGSKVQVFEGAPNNMPDDAAHHAALEIEKLAKSLHKGDIALTLITGGGSALLPAPIPPVTLKEMVEVIQLMSRSGANIHQLNTFRKNVEILKGGALAGAASPAQVISLILSDVIGSPLEIIASGPTTPDYSTARQCLDVFHSLGIMEQVPQSVLDLFYSETVRGRPKSHVVEFGGQDSPMIGPQPTHSCSNVQNVLVGSNEIAVDAAAHCAQILGYLPFILDYGLDGEARDAGVLFSAIAEFFSLTMQNRSDRTNAMGLGNQELELVTRGLSKDTVNDLVRLAERAYNCEKPVCVLAGGETTVTVRGTGKGGRNQEMALSAAIDMKHRFSQSDITSHFDIGFLSAGTDGQDGPTDAAGAYADPYVVDLAQAQAMDPGMFLWNNASYAFYSQVYDGQHLVITGLTGTNVMDLQVLLIVPRLHDKTVTTG